MVVTVHTNEFLLIRAWTLVAVGPLLLLCAAMMTSIFIKMRNHRKGVFLEEDANKPIKGTI
jgi:hypothetical protein